MTATSAAESPAPQPHSGTIKVAVVDDSAVVRGLVSRWIDEDPELQMCGRFSNGQLAVDGVGRDVPDVIVLDIEMPVMDGITALPGLLKAAPGAKVLMSSTLTHRNAEISLKALSLGATDYIPKPESNSGITTSTEFREELVRKIKAIGQAKLRGENARRRETETRQAVPIQPVQAAPGENVAYKLRAFSQVRPRILTIGSSTGGPQALAQVFEDFASAIADVPVVVTQHMPATFTAILAERLGRAANMPSKEGEHGEAVLPGHIYVAPGGMHMALSNADGGPRLNVYDGPLVNYCKPAVDPLFQSISEIYGSAALALVLTGMGNDGAAGGRTIADAGGSVIAQDQATSVVWGMPGATAAAGACAAILPLEQIGPKVVSLLKGGGQ